MSGHEFLLEILCEEIPANALPGTREQLAAGLSAALSEAGVSGAKVTVMSTARRLVVSIAALPERQSNREETVAGPPVRAAYAADGSPTQAALGFARAQGVTIDDLRTVMGPKGEVVAITKHIPGRPLVEVLAEVVPLVVGRLHFPKTMRWGTGESTFVRPVHNIVALFGVGTLNVVVPVELFGVLAGSTTVGHRVSAPGPVELRGVSGLGGYVEALERAGVVIDPAVRLARLEELAARLAQEVGCAVRPDPGLVAEHVELVEFPGVLRGAIAERALDLPEEVLVTTLRHHQKCLVLERDGHVAPYFLAVSDRADDPEGHVVRGNEWVAGARLADARFFFDQDRKRTLAEHGEALGRVVFHAKLGSFADKTDSLVNVAKVLIDLLRDDASWPAVKQAGKLAKADLVTAMVGEFPELQGVIGGLYGKLDGESDAVWQAVYDQYRPVGLDGELPRGRVGAILGVADRLDTLAGLFRVGEIPTGSKDPFALRRAALAIVRICAETPLAVDLQGAVEQALALRSATDDTAAALREFVRERVRYYLTSVANVSADVADAVLDARWGVVADDLARARALESVREEPVFGELATAFKRARNIVAKAGPAASRPDLLVASAEQELSAAIASAEAAVGSAVDPTAGFRALAQLAVPLDRFFTDVMVLCEDAELRGARLALLRQLEELFLRLADLSRLAAPTR